MGQRFDQITEKHAKFIRDQKLFFVGTAAQEGRVNISPKGMDSLRILDNNRVLWLNVTGSGNETAAHLLENERMTIMFCAFNGSPLILRLYGHARAIHPQHPEWNDLIGHFPKLPGARQIFDLNVDLVLTSCGMSVPLYHYGGERSQLNDWAKKKGPHGIKRYWEDNNRRSLDGKPTGIFD